MTRVVACPECGKRLKVPENFPHPRAKCPNCAEWLSLVEEEKPKPAPVPVPTPARKPELPEDRFAFAPDEDDLKKKRKSLYEEPEARPRRQEREEDDRPRKKRRKKRPKEEPGEGMSPALKWWLALIGFVGVLILIASGVALAGHKEYAMVYGILMLIMIPISTMILIVAMVLSSLVAGGIDFGEVHIVIPKAVLLLLLVNSFYLLPVESVPLGYVLDGLALIVWLVGLMYFFDLDFWEARFLIFINWVLNFLVKWFVIAMVLSYLMHGGPNTKPGIPGQGGPPLMEEFDDPE